ncbi:type II toxin-antitoxin system RelE/ParE family toxin [Pseudoduganella sp. LjRoot289]|uniref:type II toxin-antitoxin system RelE/ParE family toxin n=1 Tax=Pseudoduganella sp. LjRoot289 TaxID=3342314 RepID=UPI003ECD5C2C
MKLNWTSKARSDLARLHEFLQPISSSAAKSSSQALASAPLKLLQFPRMGELLPNFAPREVRRILVREYELHYEILNSTILILRIWHTRERRR